MLRVWCKNSKYQFCWQNPYIEEEQTTQWPKEKVRKDKQTNKIGICCFCTKHATFRSESKDWLVWNQDIVSAWSNINTGGRLFR
jgi:hypothetical protein